MLRSLGDMEALRYIGFESDLSFLKGNPPERHEELLHEEDVLAAAAVRLICNLATTRMGSMSWHRSWPGLLALFLSTQYTDREAGLELLKQHFADFNEASRLVAASPQVKVVVSRSPCACTVM